MLGPWAWMLAMARMGWRCSSNQQSLWIFLFVLPERNILILPVCSACTPYHTTHIMTATTIHYKK